MLLKLPSFRLYFLEAYQDHLPKREQVDYCSCVLHLVFLVIYMS
uniref:Uncharacterized protein n=1 Tax=Arundo donax TaxID=35708 RepID=A0A0A9HKD7_ARUDO